MEEKALAKVGIRLEARGVTIAKHILLIVVTATIFLMFGWPIIADKLEITSALPWIPH